MSLKQKIDQDLKTAMLAGDKNRTSTLRGLKSAILYVEVAKGSREQGLTDEEINAVLVKESKKRQESAQLYNQGGDRKRAEAELLEKDIIDSYLPEQISQSELEEIIDQAIMALEANDISFMGKVIQAVREKVGGQADGSTIAKMVKEKLQ